MCRFCRRNNATATSELFPKRRGESRNTFCPSARARTSWVSSAVRSTKLASSMISPNTNGFSGGAITQNSVTQKCVMHKPPLRRDPLRKDRVLVRAAGLLQSRACGHPALQQRVVVEHKEFAGMRLQRRFQVLHESAQSGLGQRIEQVQNRRL